MSGALPSPFLSTNELLQPMAAYDTHQNQLLSQQTTQQNLGSGEIEMMSRAAAALMDPSQYPTPEARAAAYPTLLGALQRQGFAKNAPSSYPGDDQIAGLARMGMSLKDQYGAGMIISPALKALMDAPIPGVPGYGGAGGGASGDGGAPLSSDKATALKQIAQRESGGDPTALNYVAKEDPTAYDRGATASGKYQIVNSTWAEGARLAGVDVSKYPTARSAPEAVQDQVASALWDKHGNAPWQKGAQDWVKGPGGRYTLQAVAAPGAPTGAPTAAPAVQQGGAPPAPPPAGNYAGGGFGRAMTVNPNAGGAQYTVQPPPVVRAAPIPVGRVAGDVGAIQAGMQQAQAAPGLPGGVAAAGPAAPTATATATQATPEPGWGTGGGVGSYGAGTFGGPAAPAAPPAPPAPVAQTPPPQAQAPAAPPSGTGVNSPQYQAAMALNHRAMQLEALGGNNPVVKARVAELRQQAQLMMQADSYQPVTQDGQQGQRSVLTGKFEAYPARRLHQMPDGRLLNDQGTVIGYSAPFKVEMDPNTHQPMYVPQYPTPAALSPIPGAPQAGGLAGASPVPGTTPDLGFAKEQEAEAGRLSKLRDAIIERAQESGSANTMIVNTEKAMEEAQKGNIGPSAIGPHVLNAVAAAKALGVNLDSFGIDTGKVAAGQVTREQLQQLNGAILRKMYPQRITNADLAISGSALPNYGLDPEALTANFDIYKKQNAYDTTKAQDMLAYENEHHTLKGWEHQWFAKNNFASGPLDGLFGDAATGRLAAGGSAGTGQAGPLPKAALDSLSEGHVTTFSNGQRWTRRNGQPIQVK
jgi:hypothetical protein